MKMRIAGFENEVVFDDFTNTVLSICDHKLYGHIVYCLSTIINEHSSTNEIIIVNDQDKDITKDALLIIDPMNIVLNDRTILKRLYALIESNCKNDEDSYFDYKEYIDRINMIVSEALDEINLDFSYNDNLSISDYLKAINLKISKDNCNCIQDYLLDYFEIVSELNIQQPIIICNCFSYMDEKQLEELCKYKNYKHLSVLFIEGELHDEKVSSNFHRYLIDEDYYELEYY